MDMAPWDRPQGDFWRIGDNSGFFAKTCAWIFFGIASVMSATGTNIMEANAVQVISDYKY